MWLSPLVQLVWGDLPEGFAIIATIIDIGIYGGVKGTCHPQGVGTPFIYHPEDGAFDL